MCFTSTKLWGLWVMVVLMSRFVIRAVTSVDGMTAEVFKFSNNFLEMCSNEIINKVKGIINRVCYDLTSCNYFFSKPPMQLKNLNKIKKF